MKSSRRRRRPGRPRTRLWSRFDCRFGAPELVGLELDPTWASTPSMSCARYAIAIASARLCAPSLERIRWTWVATVLPLMNRRSAIPAVPTPFREQMSTSISRGLRPNGFFRAGGSSSARSATPATMQRRTRASNSPLSKGFVEVVICADEEAGCAIGRPRCAKPEMRITGMPSPYSALSLLQTS